MSVLLDTCDEIKKYKIPKQAVIKLWIVSYSTLNEYNKV